MAYRRKMTKEKDARMSIGVGIFGTVVCIPIIVLGIAVAISALTSEKGSVVGRIFGALGAAFFIGGAGIAGVCASIGGIKEGIETKKKLKNDNG